MFNIGDKVYFDSNVKEEPIYGYIIGMEINPFEETDVKFEAKNYITYTIRVFRDFYKNGYFDFIRTEKELCLIK